MEEGKHTPTSDFDVYERWMGLWVYSSIMKVVG